MRPITLQIYSIPFPAAQHFDEGSQPVLLWPTSASTVVAHLWFVSFSTVVNQVHVGIDVLDVRLSPDRMLLVILFDNSSWNTLRSQSTGKITYYIYRVHFQAPCFRFTDVLL